ncbi:(2Fe-2S)-binding protein [Telmatospirillum siberiense]|uniref:Sarcosine oxidase subunit alpha n=1 Tax=Telmatospirillum siberiense TaxID=382514 RepID=A0A2N3PQJ1_9PROT|nr:(2Fe-2S)-binding protein [Telmatospirillum siberiense]PKU22670.1 sarcosine oxidase subunit alpha [Telmatospirillum siberiense]
MFRPRSETVPTVTVIINSRPVPVPLGSTAAAALLAGGSNVSGSTGDDRPRGPFCLMGACFGCRVTIDGESGRRACMTSVQDGMRIDFDTLARKDLP